MSLPKSWKALLWWLIRNKCGRIVESISRGLLEHCNNFEDEVLGMLRTVIWEVFKLKKKKKKDRKLMFCVLVNIHCCEKTELWNIAVCRLQYFKYCSVCFSTFSIYYPRWYPRWQKRTPLFSESCFSIFKDCNVAMNKCVLTFIMLELQKNLRGLQWREMFVGFKTFNEI